MKLGVASSTASASNNTEVFEAPAIGPHASNIHFGATGDWFIRSAAATGKVVLQDTGGNVGIGTATPNAKLQVAGNATQSRGNGGFVKAMLYVSASGTILRCYNGITGSSSGNCRFTVTRFTAGGHGINFGFQVNDRFVSVTPQYFNPGGVTYVGAASFIFTSSTTSIDVRTSRNSEDETTEDVPFMIIVY